MAGIEFAPRITDSNYGTFHIEVCVSHRTDVAAEEPAHYVIHVNLLYRKYFSIGHRNSPYLPGWFHASFMIITSMRSYSFKLPFYGFLSFSNVLYLSEIAKRVAFDH